jgi:hypothetical protein
MRIPFLHPDETREVFRKSGFCGWRYAWGSGSDRAAGSKRTCDGIVRLIEGLTTGENTEKALGCC